MNQRFFRGKDGQDYLNELDAEVYGGGLVKEITQLGTVERSVRLTKEQKYELEKKKAANAERVFEQYGTFTPAEETTEDAEIEFDGAEVVESSPEELKAAEEAFLEAMNAHEAAKELSETLVKKAGRPAKKK